ncbi:MAG: UDP-3-O-(3-hydroxymyristoyl)glucosamine N-acyltransferase [Rhodanobacteraceae bacterium]
MKTPIALGDIALRCGLELRGNATLMIRGVAALANAERDQIGFVAKPRYRGQLASTRAGAVILNETDAAAFSGATLIAPDPYVAFARVAELFAPRERPVPGIHPSAIIADDALIAASASVGPFCVVESGARIEDDADIGAHCMVGADCTVGRNSRLIARVILVSSVHLGERVLVHPGVVIGADGFGLALTADGWIKVPQQGGVRIGDDCEIGANTTIDRGTIGDTVLENDVRLDNQIQIAHNVFIGAHTAMAGCSAVAGSATIGRNCLVGGGAGILGHLSIADNVSVTAMSLVTHSIREAGEYSSGTPIQNTSAWRRNAARFKRLDELARRVGAIEKENKS